MQRVARWRAAAGVAARLDRQRDLLFVRSTNALWHEKLYSILLIAYAPILAAFGFPQMQEKHPMLLEFVSEKIGAYFGSKKGVIGSLRVASPNRPAVTSWSLAGGVGFYVFFVPIS